MDNINDLVGDAAKQLMAQADGIQNPRLKESAKRVALTVSAKTRDETITKARNAAFARIPIWAFFLPVTRRQQIVLGRIYSFQCTTNKDGSPAEYRMSLSTGASELGMTNRAEMQKDLQRLISLGFLGGIVGILAASLMNINAPYRPEGTKMAALGFATACVLGTLTALVGFIALLGAR